MLNCTSDNQLEERTQLGIEVYIPAALNRPTHTLYNICLVVHLVEQEWIVNRRYSQFLQLRSDILAEIKQRKHCPGCNTFAHLLSKIPFPGKSLLRTDRVVRNRVRILQEFLQFLVQYVYLQDKPKCTTCGHRVKELLRPFLIRGAQPIGSSDFAKIQSALSLSTFAIVSHDEENSKSPHRMIANSTRTHTADWDDAESNSIRSSLVSYVSNDSFTDEEGHDWGNYDDERCRDPALPLEEAMKEVVVADGLPNSHKDVVARLSRMWDAYDSMSSDSSRLSMRNRESIIL